LPESQVIAESTIRSRISRSKKEKQSEPCEEFELGSETAQEAGPSVGPVFNAADHAGLNYAGSMFSDFDGEFELIKPDDFAKENLSSEFVEKNDPNQRVVGNAANGHEVCLCHGR